MVSVRWKIINIKPIRGVLSSPIERVELVALERSRLVSILNQKSETSRLLYQYQYSDNRSVIAKQSNLFHKPPCVFYLSIRSSNH